MRALIQRRPFLCFYLLAIAFPTLLFTYMVGLEVVHQSWYGPQYSVVGNFYAQQAELRTAYPVLFAHRDAVHLFVASYILMPIAAPFLFFPFAPTVAAVVVTAWGWGRRALLDLLRLYLPFQGGLGWQEGLRIYAILLLGIIASFAITLLLTAASGHPEQAATYAHALGTDSLPLVAGVWLGALFLNQGGLLEELGWRGYALPLLMRRFGNPLLVSVLLGTAWALWHFPREVPGLLTGQQHLLPLLGDQLLFIAMCASMSVVATAFVNLTGGSVLPAIMIHGSLNLYSGMLETTRIGVRSNLNGTNLIVWCIAAGLVLLLVGRDLGWQRRLALNPLPVR